MAAWSVGRSFHPAPRTGLGRVYWDINTILHSRSQRDKRSTKSVSKIPFLVRVSCRAIWVVLQTGLTFGTFLTFTRVFAWMDSLTKNNIYGVNNQKKIQSNLYAPFWR